MLMISPDQHHCLAVCPRAGDFTSLNLIFHVCVCVLFFGCLLYTGHCVWHVTWFTLYQSGFSVANNWNHVWQNQAEGALLEGYWMAHWNDREIGELDRSWGSWAQSPATGTLFRTDSTSGHIATCCSPLHCWALVPAAATWSNLRRSSPLCLTPTMLTAELGDQLDQA